MIVVYALLSYNSSANFMPAQVDNSLYLNKRRAYFYALIRGGGGGGGVGE